MITLEPIGHVRSSRTDLSDDNWASVTARIELVEALPSESLDGIEAFSHAEVVYFFDRVPDAEVEGGARHPRGNTAWPKVAIFAQRGKGRPNDGTKPYPVVLICHGGGSNARQMARFCGLNDKADEAGFLAVYPSGSGQLEKVLTWNGGNCCGYPAAFRVEYPRQDSNLR